MRKKLLLIFGLMIVFSMLFVSSSTPSDYINNSLSINKLEGIDKGNLNSTLSIIDKTGTGMFKGFNIYFWTAPTSSIVGRIHFYENFVKKAYVSNEGIPGGDLFLTLNSWYEGVAYFSNDAYIIIKYDNGKTKKIYLPLGSVELDRFSTPDHVYIDENGCTYLSSEIGEIKELPCPFKEGGIIKPSQPSKPQPKGISLFISSILTWIKDLFSRIFPLTVTGPTVVEPNTQATYQIDLSATAPDSDWSDGIASWQWGNWALVDVNGNILQQGNWEEVNGRYTKSVTITTPQNIGNYMIIALIDQIDMVYNYQTKTWSSTESIVNKEAIDLKTKYTVIAPTKPTPSGFAKFIQTIIDFFKRLFGIQ